MTEQNQPLTVAELTNEIIEMFDENPGMKSVQVKGEISNFIRARSGHLYFTLKDADAQIRGVMWRSSAERLLFDPQAGDAVIVRGTVSVYAPSGQYQISASSMKPLGMGNLAVQFEELKRRLLAEGLFDEQYKQPIPAFPKKIGIVTSANAAALRDILNVINRRYPLVELLIVPTLVQGRTAPPEIVRALEWVDGRSDVDLIILARGGGSIEDLWAFNDEDVAYAVFNCETPIITGVGHEIDFTIVDFVSDMRAPTPSAAAELAVPDVSTLLPSLRNIGAELQGMMDSKLARAEAQLQNLARALQAYAPTRSIETDMQRIDQLHARLVRAMGGFLTQKQQQVRLQSAELYSVNPTKPLERGYAIVRDADGKVVKSVNTAEIGDNLRLELLDGALGVLVTSKTNNPPKEP